MSLIAVTEDGHPLHDYTPLDPDVDDRRLLGVKPVCATCGLPEANRIHGNAGATLVSVPGINPARALELLDEASGDLTSSPTYLRLREAFATAITNESIR